MSLTDCKKIELEIFFLLIFKNVIFFKKMTWLPENIPPGQVLPYTKFEIPIA